MSNRPSHTAGPWYVLPDPIWKDKHPCHNSRYIATAPESEIEVGYDEDSEVEVWRFKSRKDIVICSLTDAEAQKANAALIAAAPDLLEALGYAAELIEVARRYFPKSVSNSDKFQLENTCAAIGKAIFKAQGGAL